MRRSCCEVVGVGGEHVVEAIEKAALNCCASSPTCNRVRELLFESARRVLTDVPSAGSGAFDRRPRRRARVGDQLAHDPSAVGERQMFPGQTKQMRTARLHRFSMATGSMGSAGSKPNTRE